MEIHTSPTSVRPSKSSTIVLPSASPAAPSAIRWSIIRPHSYALMATLTNSSRDCEYVTLLLAGFCSVS